MPNKNTKVSRGRPRTFDEQAVIAHAAGVFLEQGFEAVSYERLAKEVGLSKPSLYNTFGDKTALFERVLESYADQAVAFCKAQFEGKDSLQDGVKSFLHGAADLYAKEDALSQGCLLIGTALPACAQPGQVRNTLASFIEKLEDTLEEVITRTYSDDALMLERSPRANNMLLASLLFSLAVRARTGMSSEDLRVQAEELAKTFL